MYEYYKKKQKSKWHFLSQIMPAKLKASNTWIKVTFMYTKCLRSSWCAACVIISQHCILTSKKGENSCSLHSQLLFLPLYRYIYFQHFYVSVHTHICLHRNACICTLADRYWYLSERVSLSFASVCQETLYVKLLVNGWLSCNKIKHLCWF